MDRYSICLRKRKEINKVEIKRNYSELGPWIGTDTVFVDRTRNKRTKCWNKEEPFGNGQIQHMWFPPGTPVSSTIKRVLFPQCLG
jgi:hypothetical protein